MALQLIDAKAREDYVTEARLVNDLNGRRGFSLPLPPLWQDCGPYKLKVSEGDAPAFVSLWGQAPREVPEHILKGHDRSKLYIDSNYSEKKALL